MSLWWKKNKEKELEEEVRSHLRLSAQEHTERGQETSAAEEAAHREFGNVELVKETTRDAWAWCWLENLLEDIHYGIRMLRKNPGFTAIAVLTLTLGIGANTALFSVVNAVLLSPLPYPHSEQLVTVHESKPNFETGSISYPNFLDLRTQNTVFERLASYHSGDFIMTGRGEPARLQGSVVTADLFPLLGVAPMLGRTFLPDEDKPSANDRVVILSQALFQKRFNSDAGVECLQWTSTIPAPLTRSQTKRCSCRASNRKATSR